MSNDNSSGLIAVFQIDDETTTTLTEFQNDRKTSELIAKAYFSDPQKPVENFKVILGRKDGVITTLTLLKTDFRSGKTGYAGRISTSNQDSLIELRANAIRQDGLTFAVTVAVKFTVKKSLPAWAVA